MLSMSIDVRPARTLSERVAEEIRVAMVRRRITGARLAKALEVSPAWVSYRLMGRQEIGLNDLERIATFLGVTINDLLPAERGEPSTVYPRNPAPRPSDRRPAGHPVSLRPPSGPTRTARIQPGIAA